MNQGTENPFFFHCFPQSCARVGPPGKWDKRSYSADREDAVGLELLDIILKHGLLLKPEPLRFDLPDWPPEDGSPGRTELVIPQRRACFTFAQFEDLDRPRPLRGDRVSHRDLFGRFGLGLSPAKGRRLGLLPVHYFYRDPEQLNAPGLAGLSNMVAINLLQVREILTFMAYSERERNNRRHEYDQNEQLYETSGIVPTFAAKVYIDRILKTIRTSSNLELDYLHNVMNFDHRHIGRLVDAVSMILANYQTVDSRSYQEEFLYYLQQEWRMLAIRGGDAILLELSGPPLQNPGARDAVEAFQDRCERFARSHDLSHPVFDNAVLLHGYRDNNTPRPLSTLLDVIVCPPSCAQGTRELLRRQRLEHIQIIAA